MDSITNLEIEGTDKPEFGQGEDYHNRCIVYFILLLASIAMVGVALLLITSSKNVNTGE